MSGWQVTDLRGRLIMYKENNPTKYRAVRRYWLT